MTRPDERSRWAARAAAAWHSPTLTTWASMAVRFSALLLVLPLALTRFSAAEVAVWQLFATVLMLMALLDFGLAPTFARMLALARGDRGGHRSTVGDAARLLASLRWLYVRVAIAIVLLFAAVGSVALSGPIGQLAQPSQGWWSWALVLATSGATLLGQGYASALIGMDRTALLRRWEALCGLGQIATSVAVLAAGGGLVALVGSYQAWAVFNAWRNRRLLAVLHPELFACPPARDRAVLAAVWPVAWRSGLGVLASQGLIHASGLVYAQLRPAAEVAAYLLALRFVMAVSQLAQAPFYTKLPQLATLHAGGREAEKIALAQRGMRQALWVYAAGAAAVALAVEPALAVLGSETPFVDGRFWAALALAFFVERYGAMHLQLYSLTNRIVWHIASGVTGVLLCLMVVPLHAVAGTLALPLAMLLAHTVFYAPYSVRLSLRQIGRGWLSFERSAAIPPALAMAAATAFALIAPPWAGAGLR